MALLNKESWIGMEIILVALFLSGCGTAPEEQTATVQEVSVSEPTLKPTTGKPGACFSAPGSL